MYKSYIHFVSKLFSGYDDNSYLAPPPRFRMKNRHTQYFIHGDDGGKANLRMYQKRNDGCQTFTTEKVNFKGEEGFRFISLHTGYFIHADNEGRGNLRLYSRKNDNCQVFAIVPHEDGSKYFSLRNLNSGYYMHADNGGTANVRCYGKTNDECQQLFFDSD